MSDSVSLEAILKFKGDDYIRGMEAAIKAQADLEDKTEAASKSITGQMTAANLAAKVISKAFSAITGAIGSAVNRIDTLNNYPRVMESLGFSSVEAEKSISALSDGIEGLPTTLDSIVSSAQMLTASLGDLAEGTETAVALNDMFLAGGQGAEAAARGLQQYNQMLAAGKVDMQSWKTLLEVAPGQMKQLAQTMIGATANQKDLYEAIQDGRISMEDLNAAVIKLDKEGGAGFSSFADQAKAATGGIGTAWKNIQTAITKGVAKVVDAFDKGMKKASGGGIADGFNKVKDVISKVFDVVAKIAGWIGEHFETIIKVVGMAVGAFAAFKIITTVQGWVSKLVQIIPGLISGLMGATTAQEGLNDAMTANPIGTVIAAVTALISAIVVLADVLKSDAQKQMEAFSAACKDTIEASRNVRQEGLDSINAVDSQAAANSKLVDELRELMAAQEREGGHTDEIKAKVTQLNATIEDLGLTYDETTNSLNKSTAAIEGRIKALEKEARAEVNHERYMQTLESVMEIEEKQAALTKEYGITVEEATDYLSDNAKMQQAVQHGAAASTTAYADLCYQMKQLEDERKAGAETLNELATAEDDYQTQTTAKTQEEEAKRLALEESSYETRKRVLANFIELQQGALDRALANGTATMEMLTEKNQQTAQDLQNTWQSYKDAATNIFDQLAGESELSVDKMIENLQHNQEVISQMGDNMAGLRDRFAALGLDQALLDQFSEMGPEAAGYIANLATASDEQLQTLANTYGQGGTLAWDRFTQGLGGDADASAEAVKNIVTNTEETLREAVANANWNELGEDVINGYAESLGMDQKAIDASKKIATDSIQATRTELQSNSPSKVYDSIGKDVVTGFANGLSALSTRPVTILRTMLSNMLQLLRGQVGTFEVIGRNAGNGFANGLEATRSRIMDVAQSIANSVTQTIQKALAVHSPSRVLAKIGEYAGEGLAIGLASTADMIAGVSDSIAQTIAGITMAPFDGGLRTELAYAGGGTAQSMRSELAELKEALLAQPIMLDNHMDINGREVARETAVYTRDELNRINTLTNNLGGNR